MISKVVATNTLPLPPEKQFDKLEVLSVAATDDPVDLLPAARELVTRLDTGKGVLVLSDLYGATPCNLATKLAKP